MKRHSTDVVSLVFGLLFVAIAGWWLLGQYVEVDWNVPHLGWIVAGALILLGLLGVVASLRGGDRPALPPAAPPAGSATDPEDADRDPTVIDDSLDAPTEYDPTRGP